MRLTELAGSISIGVFKNLKLQAILFSTFIETGISPIYQAIRDCRDDHVKLGDPAALSIEPLLDWLIKLMDVYTMSELSTKPI